jgi:hypothetical protein
LRQIAAALIFAPDADAPEEALLDDILAAQKLPASGAQCIAQPVCRFCVMRSGYLFCPGERRLDGFSVKVHRITSNKTDYMTIKPDLR